jgi:hypothetical protein
MVVSKMVDNALVLHNGEMFVELSLAIIEISRSQALEAVKAA